MRALNLWALLLLVVSSVVYGQATYKHPRVIELEDKISRDVSEFIQSRFPSIPFFAKVDIDPLHRRSQVNSYGYSELPIFSVSEEEITDEWDDPSLSLTQLINRTRKVVISISLPESIREAEINELKETLFSHVHLIPARDEIKINRKAWIVEEIPWQMIYIAGGVLFFFLLVILISNRVSSAKIAKALKNSKGNQPLTATVNLPPQLMGRNEQSSSSSKSEISGDVRFTDPLRLKELMKERIEELVRSDAFPTLQDMVVLDELGQSNTGRLGGVIREFPVAIQKELFSYSEGRHWLEAISKPGLLDYKCLEIIYNLSNHVREKEHHAWESLLLCVWRLGTERIRFLREIDRKQAFTILMGLPKSISIETAQEAFPGSWAALLDWSGSIEDLPKREEIEDLKRRALALKPLRNKDSLKKYRTEKEILEFLKTADYNTEKSIYNALSNNEEFEEIRPPFFKIFEMDEEILQQLVEMVSLDDLALALYDISMPLREQLTSSFGEKKTFLFNEKLKNLSSHPPTKIRLGEVREEISLKAYQLVRVSKVQQELSQELEKNQEKSRTHNAEDVA